MRKRPTCSETRGEGFGIKVIIKAPMKKQRDRAKALKALCGVQSATLQVNGYGIDVVTLIRQLRKKSIGEMTFVGPMMMRTAEVTASTRTVSTNQKMGMVRILGRCLFPKVTEKIHNDLLTYSSDEDEDSQSGVMSRVTLDVIGGSSSTGNAEASSEVPRGSTPSSAEGTITLEGAPLAINLFELIIDQRSTQPDMARIASLTELSEGCPPMPSVSLALENKEELRAEELDQLRVQLCSLTYPSPGNSAPPSSLLDEVSDLLEICGLSKQAQQISDSSKVALALQCLKRFTRVPFRDLLDPKLQAGLQTCCQILSLSQGNQEFIEMSGLVSTYIHVKQSADNDEAQIAVDWKLIEEVQRKDSDAKARMVSSFACRDRLIQREAELERELVVVRDAIAANSLEISKTETSLTAITEDLRRVATLGHHINLRERLVTSKRSQCENFWLKFQAMLTNL